MKILGIIIYMMSILGPLYIITETRIDIGGNFTSILIWVLWVFATMSIGKALISRGSNNENDNDK